MANFVVNSGAPTESLQSLADAASTTTTTLRHYFGDRAGVMSAIVRHCAVLGAHHLLAAATRPIDGVDASLRWLLFFVVEGWQQGVSGLHALGLREGLGVPQVGQAYVEGMLEPLLQAGELRIARHVVNRELIACDLRLASLQLLSPLVLALLHQDSLGGRECRALDIDAFLTQHLEMWLKTYRMP